MDHCPIVHVYQALSNILELHKPGSAQKRITAAEKFKSHKLKPIHTPIHSDKLIDAPIYHPLRYHCKMVLNHCHPQQWQQIWMGKGFPCHGFPAESLQVTVSLLGELEVLHK